MKKGQFFCMQCLDTPCQQHSHTFLDKNLDFTTNFDKNPKFITNLNWLHEKGGNFTKKNI